MTKNQLTTVISSVCFSISLVIGSPVSAEEATAPAATPEAAAPTTPPPQHTEKGQRAKPGPDGKLPETDWRGRPIDSSKKGTTTAPPLVIDPALQKAIDSYLTAWNKGDYKAMRLHESWEGGDELTLEQYIQRFDDNFGLKKDWKITKLEPSGKDEYKVLVLTTHNPPKEVAALVPPGKTVNSTLTQWWRKDGDKFVHLFNIERKKMEALMRPPTMNNAPFPRLPTPPEPEKATGEKKSTDTEKSDKPVETEKKPTTDKSS